MKALADAGPVDWVSVLSGARWADQKTIAPMSAPRNHLAEAGGLFKAAPVEAQHPSLPLQVWGKFLVDTGICRRIRQAEHWRLGRFRIGVVAVVKVEPVARPEPLFLKRHRDALPVDAADAATRATQPQEDGQATNWQTRHRERTPCDFSPDRSTEDCPCPWWDPRLWLKCTDAHSQTLNASAPRRSLGAAWNRKLAACVSRRRSTDESA